MSQVSTYFRASVGGGYAGRVFLGLSAVSAFLSAYSYLQSFSAQKEIDYRKRQLSLPIYRLSENEHVNPPWNADNINDWLYRRVEVVGRPIHRLQMAIKDRKFNQQGSWQILPLVCREDKNFEHRSGLLMSNGFMAYKVVHPTNRSKIERVDRQKFTCFVGRASEFQNHSLLQGNAYQKGRVLFTNSDLQDLAKASQLQNREQASVALLERLYETGVLDERSSHRYGTDALFSEEYPYPKTEAGALQLYKMPWDYRNEALYYCVSSVVCLLVGASIF